MSIVPRQPEADEEVIAYFSKKRMLTREEAAALAAGINPIGFTDLPFGDEHHYDSTMRRMYDDILRVLDDHQDTLTGHTRKPAGEWRTIFEKLRLPFPAELDSPEPPIEANSVQDEPEDEDLHTKERTTVYTMFGILAVKLKLDLTHARKASEWIQAVGNELGIRPPGRRTIEEHLKRARDVIEERKK